MPIPVDRAYNVTETVETRDPAAPAPIAENIITPMMLIDGSVDDTLNPGVSATASDITLPAPFNEDNQDLQVNSVTSRGVTATSSTTLLTASGGTLDVDFNANGFVDRIVYTPPVDYNSTTPFFVPQDTFTYTIIDDGRHEFPAGNVLTPDTSPEVSIDATVTLTVTPANDLPVFDMPSEVNILEDDLSTHRIDNFLTNVAGGPQATAIDEQSPDQTVSFSIALQSETPLGLMDATRLPDVSSGSFIEFFPNADQFGTAVYVVTATDTGTPTRSFSQTLTVNVRPVNDAPRFDTNVLGESDTLDADQSYSVAADGRITYRLREDNTQMFGDTSTPFFIPLNAGPPQPGYQQVGLLDVFTVGRTTRNSRCPVVRSRSNYCASAIRR